MTRQPAPSPDAGEEPAEVTDRTLWTDTRIDPVEIDLPAGVGYTLRAYRLAGALAPTDIGERDTDDDPFAARRRPVAPDDDDAEPEPDSADDGSADDDEPPAEQEAAADSEAEAEAAEPETEAATEEVPVFLSQRGRLLLFRSAESLVGFIRSGSDHDMTQLDTWSDLAERIQPADVAPLPEDSYELDLVVENLRGGHDSWDVELLVAAGEVSRDLGYALRLEPVLTALSPGSPLDDLDEALRGAAKGGVGGFMGRRRLRKIGAQQASLGWRTIIGKISAAVDWRD